MGYVKIYNQFQTTLFKEMKNFNKIILSFLNNFLAYTVYVHNKVLCN